eukprot:augustus_masked-scaffold_73-processed-gene-0.42-mRNA-1 protein AED:1.00 eAED:1.00 QI:0/0/0/0/1/1/2/0/388
MVELRKFNRGKKRWEKVPQKDLSKLLSNKQLAQQLDHKITLELLKLKEEERDYETLTQIVPKLVEDLVPEQSNSTVEQRTSDQTRELLRRKNPLWDISTVRERKELVNAVKRSARKDKRDWYRETASRIQLLFERNCTREAYALLNLVKPTTKTYARITKDDKGNKVDTCQRLKVLSDYIASQQLPPISKIQLIQEERMHYCRPIYEPVIEEHINLNPPTMDEVMICIRQLKNKRVAGVDCIDNEVLKRAGKLAVKDTKYIAQKMLQIVAEPITTLGEEVHPVKEMKYLGVVFNSTGIAQEHVLSNLDKCEARLIKYRDILSCDTLTRKVKRQLARSMVLAPGIYNLANWPLNNDIKKKLKFLTRKINSILNNVPIQEYRFCEGDLDI